MVPRVYPRVLLLIGYVVIILLTLLSLIFLSHSLSLTLSLLSNSSLPTLVLYIYELFVNHLIAIGTRDAYVYLLQNSL